MKFFKYLTPVVLIIAAISCKKGFEGTKNSQPFPETYMAVDTIYRTGENRLTSLVEANWWGISSGGVIDGYEVSIDNMQTWHYTKRQDSTFLLKIPPGADSADIVVYVRAIDQLGQVDPTPASTLFPVKNSKPLVKFIFSVPIGSIPSQNPEVVFPVLKYAIEGNDADGFEDIKEYELYINDTNAQPVILPPNTSSFLLQSVNPSADSGNCKINVNGSVNSLSAQIPGLKHNSFNVVFIRAVDKALSKSSFAATPNIFVKKVSSEVLIVNAYNSNKVFVQNFYANNLKSIGILTFDTLQATQIINNNYTQLQPDYQSQTKTFALFKKIVWFGDDASFSFSLGQRTTGEFFNKGGKFFMSVAINSSFDPLSNFLDWTPIKNLVNPPLGSVFRVNVNALVKPKDLSWPVIKSSTIIASARPFEIPQNTATIGYDSVYYGGIIESKNGQSPINWTGGSAVISKRYSLVDSKTNFVMSSIPLELFGANLNSDSLFLKLFKGELGF